MRYSSGHMRIIFEEIHMFAELFQEGTIKENIDSLFMGFTEAGPVKLFANITKSML